TKLTDNGLLYLQHLTKLVDLDLGFTSVTDEGLGHLRGLKEMEGLDLRSTAVTEVGVDELLRFLPHVSITTSPIGALSLPPDVRAALAHGWAIFLVHGIRVDGSCTCALPPWPVSVARPGSPGVRRPDFGSPGDGRFVSSELAPWCPSPGKHPVERDW